MLELEIQEGSDPKQRQRRIRDIVEDNPVLLKLCSKLEEIIFWEQNFTYAWPISFLFVFELN